LEKTFTLKNQKKIIVRPLILSDREHLQKGFHELSHETIRQRFHSLKKGFTEAELDFLTRLDGKNHFALVALTADTAEGLGVARYIKSLTDQSSAELAIIVKDSYQGLGLGTILLNEICQHAIENDIKKFTGVMDSQNDKIIRLLKKRPKFKVHHDHAGLTSLEGLL